MTAPTRGQRRAVILLLLISVVLITLDHRGEAFRGVRDTAHSVVDPAQHGVTTLVAPVGRFFGGLGDIGDSGTRIDTLEKENAELRRQLREGELTASRSAELQRLTLLSGTGRFTVMPATVTGLGPSIGFEWTVTVDAGRRDGVTVDQTVVDSDGLVGRVKTVGDTSSTIVLAVDPGSAVGVRLAGGNALGVAAGNGLGPLTFTPLDPSTRVKVGDRLVTGPYGGSTYVAGLPVGEVTAVSGDPGAPAREATIAPYVSFANLDLVGIVLAAPRTDPRDALLPTAQPAVRTPVKTP
ncbi:MAG TPA: rod shape-determining protein MreC [Mycobacteriales bacterium]|nr:rod shape-determining protein MreC [Mycobacteriales bacterium]